MRGCSGRHLASERYETQVKLRVRSIVLHSDYAHATRITADGRQQGENKERPKKKRYTCPLVRRRKASMKHPTNAAQEGSSALRQVTKHEESSRPTAAGRYFDDGS
jgi:hypothetical protein